MRLWKVDEDIIEMFLDRLFVRFGNSSYQLEQFLKEYAFEEDMSSLWVGDECDECHDDMKFNIKRLNKQMEQLQAQRDTAHKHTREAVSKGLEAKKDSQRNLAMYMEMKMKYEKLKNNSVIFSMEEEEW